MGPRSSSRGAVAFVATLMVGSAAVAAPPGPDLKAVEKAAAALKTREVEVGNLESALAVAGDAIRHLAAETRFFPTERRLLDADLLFETGDHERAAILYRDLVENPSFRGQPGYHKALFKLAESLFRTRNYVSSRHYFQRAAVPESGPSYPVAIGRLFEIAVITKDFSGCERLESLVGSFAESSPDLLYSYGKYLYHRGRTSEAEETFARVPAGAPSFSRSRYFLGVIASKTGRMDAALDHFASAGSQAPSRPGDEDVQGLAHLARARILSRLEKFEEALLATQQVPVTSSVYPESLYDAAWIDFRRGNLAPAAHALDILLLTQPTGDLALRASALRGRILTRLEDPEAAQEAYEEISASLTPLATDLDRISRDPKGLEAYFDWVTATQADRLRVEAPVGERAAAWLQSDPDMATITAMFRDLASERENLEAGLEMADRMLWTLRSGGKIVSFPALKDRILRLKETENGFLAAAVSALDGAEPVFAGRVAGEAGARYETAVQARGRAARDLARLPRSYEGYIERERSVLSGYRDVERQLFLVESVLDAEADQVLAIEEWLREARARGDRRLTEARESQVRALLTEEKASIEGIRRDVARLRETLEREMVTAESQAEMISDDDVLRGDLWKVLLEEARALEAAGATLGGAPGRLGHDTALLVQRAAQGAGAVAPLVQAVLEVAERGAAELETMVARERERLTAALSELQKTSLDFQTFARTDGTEVFRRISARLKDVLLEADLGLVDMAWEREQRLSEALRKMGQERAEKIRSLGRVEGMVRSAPAAEGPGPGAR